MKIRLKINREEIVPKEKGILTGLLEYFGKGLEVANSQMVLTFEVTCHLTGPQGPEDIMTIWMNKEEAQELSDAGVPLLTVMAPRSMLQNRRGLTALGSLTTNKEKKWHAHHPKKRDEHRAIPTYVFDISNL